MKKAFLLLMIVTPIILLPFTLHSQVNEVTVSSSLFALGFKNNRSNSSTSLDSLILPMVSAEYRTNLTKSISASIKYENYYLLNSSILFSADYIWRNMRFTIGGAGGFLNQLTLKLTPGLIVGYVYQPLSILRLGFYGRTGFFLKPLLSLEGSNYTFDQNNFKVYLYLNIGNAIFGLAYKRDMFYQSVSSTEYIKNSLKNYEIHILSNAKNSIINSSTALGGEVQDIKTESFNHKVIDFYIEQYLILAIRNFNIRAGTKMTFLMFMLEDLSNVSPPSMPRFEIKTSINYRFKSSSKKPQ